MFHFLSEEFSTRAACGYFFACTGIGYGSIMSRVPAIKLQTSMTEAELGVALLCLGGGGLIGLPLCGWLVTRYGSRIMQLIGGIMLLFAFPAVGFASSVFMLYVLFLLLGLAQGFTEVPMNTQAILVEHRWRRPCMASMHAMYSVGGLCGALFGSVFAALQCPVRLHLLFVAVLALCLFPFTIKRLLPDAPVSQKTSEIRRRVPFIIVLYGFLALCSYSAEGSAGEWGSLLLYEYKGASEHTAALVFAAFSGTMAIFRLTGDRMRERFGDFRLMRVCTICALIGLCVVLLSPWPVLCLFGYACMGAGLSVVVPIIFSHAGSRNDIAPGPASAVVATFGYSGLLAVPPIIGLLAVHFTLPKALLAVGMLCLCLVLGTPLFRSERKK